MRKVVVVAAVLALLCLGSLAQADPAPIVNNGGFDSDLSGWQISGQGSYSVSWQSGSHGLTGVAYTEVTGAPGDAWIRQNTLRAIHPGEVLEARVWHDNIGNNGGGGIDLGGRIVADFGKFEGVEVLRWTADAEVPAGTYLILSTSCWPWSGPPPHTAVWDYVTTVPEPASLLVLGGGILALAGMIRKRR